MLLEERLVRLTRIFRIQSVNGRCASMTSCRAPGRLGPGGLRSGVYALAGRLRPASMPTPGSASGYSTPVGVRMERGPGKALVHRCTIAISRRRWWIEHKPSDSPVEG